MPFFSRMLGSVNSYTVFDDFYLEEKNPLIGPQLVNSVSVTQCTAYPFVP